MHQRLEEGSRGQIVLEKGLFSKVVERENGVRVVASVRLVRGATKGGDVEELFGGGMGGVF